MSSQLTSKNNKPVRAVVLSGGGARGAYEVGVLAYIFHHLPPELVGPSRLQIICGTSVGAIHACMLTSCAHLRDHGTDRMLHFWRSLELHKSLSLRFRDILQVPYELYTLFKQKRSTTRVVFDAHYLRDLVTQQVPWDTLGSNLRDGYVTALAISATHIRTGRTTIFVDRPDGGVPTWSNDKRVVAIPARIGPRHALASAAIPLIFPAIELEGSYYCDGGLRQNTPLSPALRLGANRVLVIGLRSEEFTDNELKDHNNEELYPSPMFLLGKALNAIMLDHLDYDLARLHAFNFLIRDGVNTFGQPFLDHLNQSSQKNGGGNYQLVDTLLIRPSKDIGYVVGDFVREYKPKLGGFPGWLLSRSVAKEIPTGSELLSYILFDGRYAECLIQLGMADAKAAHDKLVAFFTD